MMNNTPNKFDQVVSLDKLNKFERDFEEQLKYNQVPGAAFAIVYENELIQASGCGVRDLETKEPVTPETLFQIGSMTKSMTAVMNATQVEAGIFDWETLVKDISPHFKFADRRTRDHLQVRHLIGMRSGLRDPIGPNESANDKYWEGQSAPYVIRSLTIAILNHLCNSCRGKPPVVARFGRGRHGGTTPTYFANHLGLLYAFSRHRHRYQISLT